MISAFGIEHGEEFFKSGSDEGHKYTTGRAASAQAFGVWHPIVAGKKGKKARATGRTFVRGEAGAITGNLAGGAAGAALTRKPGGAVAGSVAGGLTGGQIGLRSAFKENNRRGYYKEQK